MTTTARTHKQEIKTISKLQWFADKANDKYSDIVLGGLADISQTPDFYAPQVKIWGEGADEVLPIDFVNHQALTTEGGLVKVVEFGLKDLYHLCQIAEASGKLNASLSAEIERLCESAGWEFIDNSRLFAVVADGGIICNAKSGNVTYCDIAK